MTYQLSTSTGALNLLAQIATFAGSVGWTVDYSVSGQIGMHKGACYVALGVRTTTPSFSRQMLHSGGSVTDEPIVGALCTVMTGTQNYYSHPGSLGSTYNSVNHVWTNDWYGPFSEVHMFADTSGNHIHVIARTGMTTPRVDSRYSMLSFGFLDGAGMTTPAVPYVTGSSSRGRTNVWERTSSFRTIGTIIRIRW